MPGTLATDVPLSQEQLAQAFGAFSCAAQALERSYLGLGQEVQRLQRELAQERDLRQRREALAEVSAILAHEIRNPLGSLELFTGLLVDSELPDKEKQWVQQVQSGIRIVSATVNNILEFHGAGELTLQPTDLHSILRSVQALLAPVAQRAAVRWETELHAMELWIPADRQRLEQVFLNLALNVFRFAAQGGVLRIRTGRRQKWAMAWFEDEGPGIASDVLRKIFQPGITTRSGGTGLGMAVAKRIVELHGGQIEVASTSGRGTIFSLQLPLIEDSAAGAIFSNGQHTKAAGAAA
ncbi:MAG TPA: HAMP domain-containing sensor histidine kinase [Terriglobales bacterium]